MMPASNAAISSPSAAKASLAFEISLSSSLEVRSKDFFLLFVRLNCDVQYSFFSSSACCSFFNSLIIPSQMPTTLSKTPRVIDLLPDSAKIKKFHFGWWWRPAFFRALRTRLKARDCIDRVLSTICMKLLAPALGNVFLKRSKASSSLINLMVSAKATSSLALRFDRSRNSTVLVWQFFSKLAKNASSAASALVVSSKSSFIPTNSTPSSPIRFVFSSMEEVRASTSSFLAALICSYDLIAAFSLPIASARFIAAASSICFRMPIISPLFGAYSDSCFIDRKELRTERSGSWTSAFSNALRSTCAAPVCRKPPETPFSMAITAFFTALIVESNSVFSAANAFASFSLIRLASATAFLAAWRSC
mmetsp:Transcript_130435/g.254156  ORF Transcript_130435/g.254156 Transcript_130435/m.254156 type:complete len:363 (+) Transcript_130435:819-1907(+)